MMSERIEDGCVNMGKIFTKKVSETVEEEIEKMIESGKFQSGEKLPSVRELCDLFGVGRSAVRDAITTLKGKGTVYVKQGEGTYICEFDSAKLFTNHMLIPNCEDIKDLFQVRKILETGIAEMAASNRSVQDLVRMEEILSNLCINGWEGDYHFHMAIANATGNKSLIQLVQTISTTMKKAMIDFHRYIQENEDIVKTMDEQHDKIYESIKMGNPIKANQSMINHLQYVEEILQNNILQKV